MSETLVQEAIERYEEALAHESDLRTNFEDDIDFAAGNQWPSQIKMMRESDTANGPRPCLVMDKITQYQRQVVNDCRQNRPAIKVRAANDNSSAVAQVVQGICRLIEDQSRADIAYDRGIEAASGPGRGWIRLTTDYIEPGSREQFPKILSVADPLSIVPDCDYVEPDGSDMQYAFVHMDMSEAKFKRLYPRDEPASFMAKEGWWTPESVRIVEYFVRRDEQKNMLQLATGQEVFEEVYTDLQSKMDGRAPQVADTRLVTLPRVKWYKLTCYEVLEETDWLGKWIPLVPVHGNEIWVKGKRDLYGMIRRAKDPLRLYNYSRSAFAELIALAPKAPFILAEGQVEGYEDEWQQANRVNKAYLPYKPVDIAGHQVPPPQRQPFAGVPQGLMQDMAIAEHDVQAALGMYAPSVGQPSNERSGKAILARQREGDVGSYHYRDNLGRSIRHLGRMMVDLIPKVLDTRRILRIVGEDGVETQVIIDPSTQQPVTEVQTLSGEVRKLYNPGLGSYDVSISVGPGYATKREEAANAILQLTQAAPQLFAVVGDLLVKSMDWPYADEIARRLRLLMPAAIRPEGEGKPAIPPEAQQKILQLTQMIQAITEKMKEIDEERVKLKGIVDGKVIDQQIKQADATVKLRELDLKEQELGLEAAKLRAEGDKLLDAQISRDQETGVKIAEAVKADSDFTQLAKATTEGFVQMAEGLEGVQKAVMQLAQGIDGLIKGLGERESARDSMHEEAERKSGEREEKLDGALGALAQAIADLPRSLQKESQFTLEKLSKVIEDSQTVGVRPAYDKDGKLTGGEVISAGGKRRNVRMGD